MLRSTGEIVIVEDDDGTRQAIERLLRCAGFLTASFASAEALLQAGAAINAACLVLDVHLPGISGFELQRALAECGAELPVIFITAYDDTWASEQAQRLGAIAFCINPSPDAYSSKPSRERSGPYEDGGDFTPRLAQPPCRVGTLA